MKSGGLMRIYFVRHGESQANVNRIYSNRGWKHPLTERGRQQAVELAQKLVDRGVVAVYTSPVRRAVETAQVVASRLDVPCEVEPGLAEWDVGIYEDRPHEEGAAAYDAVEREWLAGRLDARIPQGESSAEIHARFLPVIERLVDQYRDQPGAALVLVGHGGTYRHALPKVLTNVSCEFAMTHGLDHVNFVEAELRDGSLRCVRWCDQVTP